MTVWKVSKSYGENDSIFYIVMPYNLWGHIKSCIRWCGFKELKNTYLSKKKAEKIAAKKNNEISNKEVI